MNTTELREKAKAATAGPWATYDDRNALCFRVESDGRIVATTYPGTVAGQYLANAAFIAAFNPTTALALLDEIDRLRAALIMIAHQRLITEMSPEELTGAEFDLGYEACIRRARSTLGETQ